MLLRRGGIRVYELSSAAPSQAAWTDAATAIATIVYASAAVLTLVVIVVAALFARSQLEELERGRHAQTLLHMSQRWDSEPILQESKKLVMAYKTPTDLEQAMRRLYGKRDPELTALLKMTAFYEELGVLVNQKALSFEMVDEWLGEMVRDHWIRWAASVAFARSNEALGRERLARNWEELAGRIGDGRGLPRVPAIVTAPREGC